MSSRAMQNKHLEETMSVRDFTREERFGRGVSPYKHSDQLSVEFSFKQIDQSGGEGSSYLYKSQSIMSLKHNLQHLPKSQIIELLLQEINSSHGNPIQRQKLNDTLKDINKFKTQDNNYKQQYDQLVRGFQQYINNTQQAQQHYIKMIEDLKKQIKSLETQLNKKTHQSKHSQAAYSPHSQKSPLVIQKLQQTVQNYIQINNQLIGKVEKLQRLNKQLSEERCQSNDRVEIYKEENQFLTKQNQKLKKQNSSFKSIIDELKYYIMARRQAKDNESQVSQTSRSNKSADIRNEQNIKKQFMISKYEDSIIQSSQIKRRDHTFSDSTILFEKDSHGLTQIEAQHNKQSQRYYKQQQQDEYDESMHTSHLISTQTLVIMQNQNHELKITNEKLEKLLEKKSERINLLEEENQALKSEVSIVNEEIAQLRLKGKRNQAAHCHDQSITTASRCTNHQDMKKSSTSSTPKQQFYTKSKKPQWQTSNQGFIKRSHCTQSGFKTQQHLNNIDIIQEQNNKSDENRFRKSFNLDEFNFIKGQSELRSPYHEKKVQRGSEQYYVAQTLNISNKKF